MGHPQALLCSLPLPTGHHHTTLSPLVLPHGAPSRMSGTHGWKGDSGKGRAHPREPIFSSRSGWASLGGPWLCPGDPDPRDASHPTPLSSSKASVGASMTLTSSPAKQGLNPGLLKMPTRPSESPFSEPQSLPIRLLLT